MHTLFLFLQRNNNPIGLPSASDIETIKAIVREKEKLTNIKCLL